MKNNDFWDGYSTYMKFKVAVLALIMIALVIYAIGKSVFT